MTAATWRDLAACRGADRARFFPEKAGPLAAATIRRFCVGCPVAVQCRREAEEQARRAFGVWGARFYAGVSGQVWTLADLEEHGRTEPAGERPRTAVCRWCRVSRSLRVADGRLRSHWIPQAGGGKTQCPGSGYLPQEEK